MHEQQQMEELVERAKTIIDCASIEGRSRTPSEEREVGEIHARLKELRAQQDGNAEVKAFLAGSNAEEIRVAGSSFGRPGDQFIASAGYKSIQNASARGQTWSSGPVEVGALTKGTLTTDVGQAPTPPSYSPGIVSTLFQRPYFADLIPSEQTTAGQVKYPEETTATNAATAVAEAGTKPESTLDFTERTVSIRKFATVLPVSDEMLEDAPQIQAFLNSRLSLFVSLAEEQQLIRGSGVTPNLQGIIGGTSVNTTSVSGTAGTAITEAMFTVMNNTRGSSQLDPTFIAVHPTQYAAMRLSKDSQANFYGGGPWTGAYGGPQGPAGASQFSAGAYWGVNVYVTTAVGSGTALVGSAEGARIYRRGGLTVEASNSHGSYFAQNLVALRAETRLGLAIFRPSAFTTVTFT